MKAIKKPVKVSCWLITQKELDDIWKKKTLGEGNITSFADKLHGAKVWFRRERKDEGHKKGWGDVIVQIDTLEGSMRLKAGEYLIKGVAGEFYSCRADIFRKTYKII